MIRRKGMFTLYSTPGEFQTQIGLTRYVRPVSVVQNHHTAEPSYNDFTGDNHFALLEGMLNFHVHTNSWRTIGQNLTTFPDGSIAICRPIDQTPAGIKGANTGHICIEHLGFFDQGRDIMSAAHSETVVQVNAILCHKFDLTADTRHIVYHHWFDATGKRFSDSFINAHLVYPGNIQKTCPGTAFFGGNRIIDATAHLLPAVQVALNTIRTAPITTSALISRTVVPQLLNVRSGPGTQFAVVDRLPKNAAVNIVFSTDGWSRISNTRDEWVNTSFLQ